MQASQISSSYFGNSPSLLILMFDSFHVFNVWVRAVSRSAISNLSTPGLCRSVVGDEYRLRCEGRYQQRGANIFALLLHH